MENSNKIVPPHLNAEVYRTDTTGTSTVSYLDYINIHSDGSILVGCSELTGRYWNGGANINKSITEARQQQIEPKKHINLISGTADGCFLDISSKVLLCEDNGAVSVWSNNEDAWKQWSEDISVAEHDDAALAVDCLYPGKEYVTVGADGNVKVWDVSEMICIRNFSAAHSMAIYSVATQPNSNSCFATGSLDQYITLWDDNINRAVLDLYKNNCGVRCLSWIDEKKLLFGDESGTLSMLDIRKDDDIIKVHEFPAAVHRIAVQPESAKVAVCCDNKIVSVCDVYEDSVKVIYDDKQAHHNYVRGITWDVEDKNILYSLGWGGEIITHTVL